MEAMGFLLSGLALLGISLLAGVQAQNVCEPLGFPKQYYTDYSSRVCCRYENGSVIREPEDCIDCVDVRQGNLNLILTIPHDGSFSPIYIPDRTVGCLKTGGTCIYQSVCPDGSTRDATSCKANTVADYRSGEVAFKIHDYILQQTGKCPTVIKSILHRSKLDPNRNDANYAATNGNEHAINAYQWYHESIGTAINQFSGKPVLLIGIHGYASNQVNWTALGYSISYDDLNDKTNEELDAMKDNSSIGLLIDRIGIPLSDFLFGENSFGGYLEEGIVNGKPLVAVPAPKRKPAPYESDYFAATLSPAINDHTDKADAFQAEIHQMYRDHDGYLGQKNKTLRQQIQDEYAEAFGNAVIKFFKFFNETDPCNPNPCQNGGFCEKDDETSYTCRCPHRYTGTDCQTYIEPTTDCISIPWWIPDVGKPLYCFGALLRLYYKKDDKCCRDRNECNYDVCSSMGKCLCTNLPLFDYSCVLPTGLLCPLVRVLVTIVILAGVFSSGMALLAGPEFYWFTIVYAPLISAVCGPFNICIPVAIRQGSLIIDFKIDLQEATDPMLLITESLEANNITGAVVSDIRSVNVDCDGGEFIDDLTGSCVKCPYGTFSNNSVSCIKCQPGYFQDGEGQTACKPCWAGSYASNPGSNNCSACPVGHFSSEGSANCSQCEPGHIAEAEGQELCKPCNAGTAPNAEMSHCDSCSAGTYSAMGIECVACAPGYVSIPAQATCTMCLPGTEPSEDLSECVDCKTGTYSSDGVKCLPCDPNQYSTKGSDICSLCNNGSVPTTDLSGCIPCEPGYFAVSGDKDCENCQAGTVSTQPGQAECTPCDGGYIPDSSNFICDPCPAGYWSSSGDSSCRECTGGTVSSEGQSSCSECANGSSPNAQKSECIPCPAGKYAVSGFAECLPCAQGTYSTEGEAACSACPAGNIPNIDQSGCAPCPPGNWSQSGDYECRPCPGGSVSQGGQPNCTECNAGTVPNLDKSECVNCSAGFMSSAGDVICSPCPRDHWSLPGSDVCSECNIGEMPLRDQTGCVQNIAFGKPTKQKSGDDSNSEEDSENNSDEATDDSSNAVDGDFYGTCSHTKSSKKTWWKVDLGGWFNVSDVVIQARDDCCGEMLHNLVVNVKGRGSKAICGQYLGPATTGERIYISCDPPVVGKKIKITKTTDKNKEVLEMCEVFVLGTPVEKPNRSEQKLQSGEKRTTVKKTKKVVKKTKKG